mmetsp:Transcript_29543/g.102164  ORF Transcript_29543/g.102164 Transcript_29543/m.102164 type:complete len:265 (-) Transcript_29543:495-1289(-)
MCDFTLARMPKLPVSLLITGLLYCRDARVVGQAGEVMNLVDLALLPVTPVMGDGSAPLQPLEVGDCAARIAALALGEASLRVRHESSQGLVESSWARLALLNQRLQYTLRVYDAVGPETLSLLELLRLFARLNGRTLRPAFVGYRNTELVLNVASLGNLNRQFVSLLRSEQGAASPSVGDARAFEKLLGPEAKLARIGDALANIDAAGLPIPPKKFPFAQTMLWAARNPGVIAPGLQLLGEVAHSFATRRSPKDALGPREGPLD